MVHCERYIRNTYLEVFHANSPFNNGNTTFSHSSIFHGFLFLVLDLESLFHIRKKSLNASSKILKFYELPWSQTYWERLFIGIWVTFQTLWSGRYYNSKSSQNIGLSLFPIRVIGSEFSAKFDENTFELGLKKNHYRYQLQSCVCCRLMFRLVVLIHIAHWIYRRTNTQIHMHHCWRVEFSWVKSNITIWNTERVHIYFQICVWLSFWIARLTLVPKNANISLYIEDEARAASIETDVPQIHTKALIFWLSFYTNDRNEARKHTTK